MARCCGRRNACRMVPVLGCVRESSGAVAPTPRYKRWPLFGVCLMAFKLEDGQQVPLSVAFLDKHGHPATVDGAPEWFVDNSEVLALEPAADGMSCLIKAVGPIGTATVSMKADADLGDGVKELVGLFEVEVTAGQATTVVITPGTPTEQE